jgi:hypothetical protein
MRPITATAAATAVILHTVSVTPDSGSPVMRVSPSREVIARSR